VRLQNDLTRNSISLAHLCRRDRIRLPNCTAGPWLFSNQFESPPTVRKRKIRTLVFFSLASHHEHNQRGHLSDDSVPLPRECIYLELYHPSTQYFGEYDTPAVTHGQSGLLQRRAIGFPQIIPRIERYLRFRTPANSFEEAFWGRDIACEEREREREMPHVQDTTCEYLLAEARV
jgi:hypothetical protein